MTERVFSTNFLTRRLASNLLIALLVGVLAQISGCASSPANLASDESLGAAQSSPDSSAAPGTPPIIKVDPEAGFVLPRTVERDQDRWTLPTDPYQGEAVGSLGDHTLALLRANCMRRAGYSDYIPYWDSTRPPSETMAGDLIMERLTPELATKYGYRQAKDPRYLIADEVESGFWDNLSEQFEQDLMQCNGESDRIIEANLPNDNTLNEDPHSIEAQLNQLMTDRQQPALIAAAAGWRDCMAPLGIVDLPDFPWDPTTAPPESLVDRWDWKYTGRPSAEEVSYAQHDIGCRNSSGWTDELYNAEWTLREDFVERNQALLEPMMAEMEHRGAVFTALIKAYSSGS